ncbi:sensor histidine kinase N-terminal domain-containing protein [Stappia sp. F7233]|uniref:histidine kinase n=1 Tax=Stappia albiluteola TaxID=2758565 RepID=A0A839AG35_9HYPH|nr:sensor histidine kinase [Stappia albiluteola]MBA5778830.1 sensor histidine kinase N-terminal domain-containing protein [Stappia albiluteola]
MPRLQSLTARLLAWLLVPLSVLAGLALLDTYREARQTANAVFDRVLAGSALAIAERVAVTRDGLLEVDVPYVALEMLTSASEDRVFYRVEGPNGLFVTGYRQLPVPPPDPDASAESALSAIANVPDFHDADFRGEPIRLAVLSGAASSGEQSIPYRLAIAETTTARRALARDILLRSAARQGLLIVIAAVAVLFGVRRALRPLARLEEAIARRSTDDLRPIHHRAPREVERLVDAINSFMARLETALNALKHFTGNASHQLRTPLAVIRTQIELARRSTDANGASDALERADTAVLQSERTLAQLLLLARIDEAAIDRAAPIAFDLVATAQAVTADLEPKAARAGLDLGFDAPGTGDVKIVGNRMLVEELLRNLIENAIAYAGHGRQATVRISRFQGRARLEVEDNGPGIAPEKRAAALGRFARLDPEGPQGAGLGLSIVEEIAALMSARLELLESRSGGLLVRVTFPVTPAD